jgi:hypothetical protein
MSDQSDRNIVITVFVIAFFYMNYLRIKIDIKNDWENMKCNPMNLWTSSFFKDPKTANSNFNSCINTLSSDSINSGLQAAYKQQQIATGELSNMETKLKGYLQDIENNISGHGGLVDQYKINETKIEDLKEKQTTYSTINTLLAQKDPDKNNLYNFTNNVKDIFDNIQTYLPTISINQSE